MTVPAPEFSHLLKLDEIPRLNGPIQLSTNETERAALARRFGFVAVDRLEASIDIAQEGTTIIATGQLRAAITQTCTASGEPVAELIDEPFVIRFVPEGSEVVETNMGELEIDAQDADLVPYSDGRIDLGEAMAETLGLAANPYPRAPDADEFLRKMGVKTEEQAGPFAALAALKKG